MILLHPCPPLDNRGIEEKKPLVVVSRLSSSHFLLFASISKAIAHIKQSITHLLIPYYKTKAISLHKMSAELK